MATSRSAEATALVYSGRADPAWAVFAADAERLVAVWADLPAASQPVDPPVLGYRGVLLRPDDAGPVLHAYGGVARRGGDLRADVGRAVEAGILSTAPEGLLPEVPGMPGR